MFQYSGRRAMINSYWSSSRCPAYGGTAQLWGKDMGGGQIVDVGKHWQELYIYIHILYYWENLGSINHLTTLEEETTDHFWMYSMLYHILSLTHVPLWDGSNHNVSPNATVWILNSSRALIKKMQPAPAHTPRIFLMDPACLTRPSGHSSLDPDLPQPWKHC